MRVGRRGAEETRAQNPRAWKQATLAASPRELAGAPTGMTSVPPGLMPGPDAPAEAADDFGVTTEPGAVGVARAPAIAARQPLDMWASGGWTMWPNTRCGRSRPRPPRAPQRRTAASPRGP
eukprot:12723691-Heterocapsa_arctica.AAC.1